MADFDLNIKHPLLEEYKEVLDISRDFFEGEVSEYLQSTPHERSVSLRERIKRSTYQNLYRPIVNARVSMLTMRDPSIVVPDELFPILNDPTGNSMGITSFLRQCITTAEVDGVAWVIVDSPASQGVVSKQQQESIGIRPFAKILKAGTVINWEENPIDKQLDWIVLKTCVSQNQVGTRPARQDRWFVFTRDEIIGYRLESGGNYVQDSVNKNTIGRIPLVPFYGIRTEEKFFGVPIGVNILNDLQRIYNLESQIDYTLDIMTMPRLYITLEESSALRMSEQIRDDGTRVIDPPRPDNAYLMLYGRNQEEPKIGYVEPTGKGVELAKERATELVNRVLRTTLHMHNKNTALVQSAESLREEAALFRADLASTSKNHEASTRELFEVFSLFFNRVSKTPIDVKWNKDFETEKLQPNEVAQWVSLFNNKIIDWDTVISALIEGDVMPSGFDPEGVRKSLNLPGVSI